MALNTTENTSFNKSSLRKILQHGLPSSGYLQEANAQLAVV